MSGYRRGIRRAFGELLTERPNLRLVELPNSSHVGLTGHDAATTAAVITRFLQDLTNAAVYTRISRDDGGAQASTHSRSGCVESGSSCRDGR